MNRHVLAAFLNELEKIGMGRQMIYARPLQKVPVKLAPPMRPAQSPSPAAAPEDLDFLVSQGAI